MTKQVKVFFVFLAVTAVVSVFSFFDIFTGVRSAKLFKPTVPLLPLSDDADQDGLSDKDESYWNTDFQNPDTDGDGFLDGEEVVSGFDPREPSSHELGDNLEDTVYGGPKEIGIDFNLTEDTLATIITGAYAQDLKPGVDDTKFTEGVDAISFSVIDNFYKIQNPPPITQNIIDDSKENQLSYINSIAEIIKNDLLGFSQKLNTSSAISSQLSFFAAKSEKIKTSHEKLAALSVPETWSEIHTNILNLLYRFYLNYRYLAGYNEDTIKAMLALADISNSNLELPLLLKEVKAKIVANNLPIDNSLYQVLDLIYKE